MSKVKPVLKKTKIKEKEIKQEIKKEIVEIKKVKDISVCNFCSKPLTKGYIISNSNKLYCDLACQSKVE